MKGEDFAKHLLKQSEAIEKLINEDSPIIMCKEAVDFFTESFQKQGFTDQSLMKWKEVKRRMDPPAKGAKGTRAILKGDTGDLGRSLDHKKSGDGEVIIFSDLPYSKAHNEGGKLMQNVKPHHRTNAKTGL